MMSEPEDTKLDTQEEKHPKKKLRSGESSSKSKVKKSSSLIKRFKLKGKSASSSEGTHESEAAYEEPQPVSLAQQEQEIAPVERQTPEGDDSNPVEKAASETNLTETSWKSAENLSKEDNVKSTSVINVQTSEYRLSVGEIEKHPALPQRTKSLENIKGMPAFGELILDPQTATVTRNKTTNFILLFFFYFSSILKYRTCC